MRFVRLSAAVAAPVLGLSLVAASLAAQLAYPPTRTVPVADTYFGTKVADPYRWLEADDSPEVKAWAAAQTALATKYLKSRPSYAYYAKRIAALSKTSALRFRLVVRRNRYFYLRQTPPQPQPVLIARDGLHGPERVLFDPATLAGADAPPSIESVFVSPDGTKVAFTTQLGGSENETLHVVMADPGAATALSDEITHAGGGTSPTALVWDAGATGFLHTRFSQNPDGTYATSHILIYHHVLGTDPATDAYVFGKELSDRSEYSLRGSLDGKVQSLTVADGDGPHASIYLRRTDGGDHVFSLVADPSAAIGDSDDPGGSFVGDEFYAISKKRDSRGEIVALAPSRPFSSAKTIVPASSLVIESLLEVPGGFITRDVDGGDGSARYFASDGRLLAHVPVPRVSAITALAADPAGGDAILGYENYATPDRWLRYDTKTNALSPTGIEVKAPGDYSKLVQRRVLVPSLDGKVKIPLEIVSLPGIRRDGSAPTVLYAYGAYGIISRPFFSGSMLAWFERGGVFAQAYPRGGGEYGDAWHEAAVHATKTLTSDDLAAAAKWLGQNGYGDRKHLAIWGGSAGGFLMGLALTRNPNLYRAVVGEVGIYDLLRSELTPNGAYNIPEFGTVKDPAQFVWMLEQSPYHNVVKGRAYPAVLLETGENDPRVEPFSSRKMIARLQAASSSPYPLLLIQKAGQGHGIGNSFQQELEEETQSWTFFESQLR
jgi:prolyl oligopeptidase